MFCGHSAALSNHLIHNPVSSNVSPSPSTSPSDLFQPPLPNSCDVSPTSFNLPLQLLLPHSNLPQCLSKLFHKSLWSPPITHSNSLLPPLPSLHTLQTLQPNSNAFTKTTGIVCSFFLLSHPFPPRASHFHGI